MAGTQEGTVPLPKFSNPPVVEMAVAIEFVPLPALNTIALVQTHSLWSDAYPKVQEQAPLAPTTQPEGLVAGFGLRLGGMPSIRLWMMTQDDQKLLQVQNDRLVLNWRKVGSAKYPSFDDLLPEFAQRWEQFADHLAKLGPPRPLVAEVTYVNRIQAPGESPYDVSSVCSLINSYSGPGKLESTRAQFVANVPDGHGRTFITIEPDVTDMTIGLTVTTRMTLGGEGDDISHDTAFAALHRAHACSVLGFASSTTDEMHERWGRTA